jgi:hypothetical protein
MILAFGIDLDDTFSHFVREALLGATKFRVVNLRAAVDGEWRFDAPCGAATLRYKGETFELHPEDGYYCRIIDLSSHEPDAARARRWQALLAGLRAWLDAAPGRVANRGHAGSHNSAKPLHEAVLLRLGFQVPESLTSCDVSDLLQFVREGAAISKTVSGVRADAVVVSEADFEGFVPESGPVHLQRLVRGSDARVHVVGDSVVAQRVTSALADYRRAEVMNNLEVFEPPAAVRALLVEATSRVGLTFAGWDFKIDDDGTYWCLEVNPMPGYAPYDRRCGGAISRALIQFLGANGCS